MVVIFYFFVLLVATILPALIWLLFFLKEDIHPEPKKLIIYAFAMGGLISMPTLAVQIFFQNFILNFLPIPLLLITGLAFAEEIFKFLAAYWSVNKEPAFDEPIDAMIYMIAASLGFATIENLFIAGNQLQFQTDSITSTFSTLSLRFVGATLLHTLSSGLVGYYWAKGKISKSLSSNLTAGLIIATVVHVIFNYLVLRFQDINLIYPSLFLIVAAFFVFNDFEKLKIRE